MSHLFNGARLKVWNDQGTPLAGGKVFTYASGTLTPKASYSDAAATVPNANPIILDQNGEADVWLVGTYKILIKDSNNVTLAGYPVDYIPGDSVATNELAAATGAAMVGATQGNLQTVLDSIIANARKVPVRQCALSGPHDATGAASLGGATGSTIVTTSGIAAGANRLTVTAGGGFNADGALDYIGYSESNLVFSGLSTNGTMYLYVDITPSTGFLTTGASALAPVYGNGAPSTANGQFTYVISEGIAYVGNGGTAMPSPRVFLGQVTVAGGVVTAINWYAYRGEYRSGKFAVANSTAYIKPHNVGVADDLIVQATAYSTATGDPMFPAPFSDGTNRYGLSIYGNSATSVSLATGVCSAYGTTGAIVPFNQASIIVKRSW